MKEMSTMCKILIGMATIQAIVVVMIAFVFLTDVFLSLKEMKKNKNKS